MDKKDKIILQQLDDPLHDGEQHEAHEHDFWGTPRKRHRQCAQVPCPTGSSSNMAAPCAGESCSYRHRWALADEKPAEEGAAAAGEDRGSAGGADSHIDWVW